MFNHDISAPSDPSMMNASINPSEQQKIFVQRSQRSPPIPKEVNKFVLANFGAIYYKSVESQQRVEILRQIEAHLVSAGYKISGAEVERRLKNMKSHYRRKKGDLELGLVASIEWEYFDMLDEIFKDSEPKVVPKVKQEVAQVEMNPQPGSSSQIASGSSLVAMEKPSASPIVASTSTAGCEQVSRKREAEEEAPMQPHDLSTKRARVIEFFDKPDLSDKLPVNININMPQEPIIENIIPAHSDNSRKFNTCNNVDQETFKKIVESIRIVDQQRIELNKHIVILETRRCELDAFGQQLSQILHKLTN